MNLKNELKIGNWVKFKKKSIIHFEIREKLAHKELSKRELIYVLEILNNLGNVL